MINKSFVESNANVISYNVISYICAFGFGHGSFTLFSYDYYKNILYKIRNY